MSGPLGRAYPAHLKDTVINYATDRTPLGAKVQRDVVPERRSETGALASDHFLDAPVTADLAVPTGPLEPLFPLPALGTQAVLYEAAADQLRLHWMLATDDLLRALSSFPANGGSAVPILRLCRLRDNGAREVVAERLLRAARVGGQGETAFRVGTDYGRFSVDLGLRNDDGGWLVLTRSNQVQRAGSLGLSFPIDPAVLARVSRKAVRFSGRRDRGPEAIEMATASPSAETVTGEDSWTRGLAPGSESAALGSRVEPPDVPQSKSLAEGQSGSQADAVIATESPTQIPTLVYGCRTPLGNGVLVEAELHVRGCATPNTEIELFGRLYRVGAGGRFGFVIKVDDPELLKRAFALHPPPESVFTRDD